MWATLGERYWASSGERRSDCGALVLLRTVKDSFHDFLNAFDENVKLMKLYPLRLIIVDPVNAIAQSGSEDLRTDTLDLFKRAKDSGTNVWLIREERSERAQPYCYEQNIADTVIRLSSKEEHGYAQRYIEVLKSRLQREQRGRHAFSIVPGEGISIYPSSAAVSARIRPRTVRPPATKIEFGLPGIDEILGPDAIKAGDVIVLKGPRGCHKTPLGILFLLGSDSPAEAAGVSARTSLIVAARESEASLQVLLSDELFRHLGPSHRKDPRRDVRVCAIESGYVKPGQVLQRIEEELTRARRQGRPVDRVMIDNVGHWETRSLSENSETLKEQRERNR
jgi:KaiC/GvpD/RAD55 family RecA-like ATPase